MTDHADTIRRRLMQFVGRVSATQQFREVQDQLRQAQEERDAARAGGAELIIQLEQAIDALREASERLGELTQPPWNELTPLVAEVRDEIRAFLKSERYEEGSRQTVTDARVVTHRRRRRERQE